MHPIHHFFDLDGTIVERGGNITPKMIAALAALPCVTVVTGADFETARRQLAGAKIDYFLTQSGNEAYNGHGTPLWMHKMVYSMEIAPHIEDLKYYFNMWDVTVKDRGGLLHFSPLGPRATDAEKAAFDPDSTKRQAALKQHPFKAGVHEVSIGGRAGFDYVQKGWNKADNVCRLIAMNRWNDTECLYIGDGFFPFGNDDCIADGNACPWKPVTGPDAVLALIS